MRSNYFFFCPLGHIFQHDSLTDESVAWDSHVPAQCKECDAKVNLMGPFLSADQAEYVMNRRWKNAG